MTSVRTNTKHIERTPWARLRVAVVTAVFQTKLSLNNPLRVTRMLLKQELYNLAKGEEKNCLVVPHTSGWCAL